MYGKNGEKLLNYKRYFNMTQTLLTYDFSNKDKTEG